MGQRLSLKLKVERVNQPKNQLLHKRRNQQISHSLNNLSKIHNRRMCLPKKKPTG